MFGKIYALLEGPPDRKPARYAQGAIQVLIILNVAAVVVSTLESVQARYGAFLRWFEMASIAVFTVEYLLRLASCTNDPRYRRPVAGRLRWAGSFFAIADLLAILPAYLPFLVTLDLRFLRILRFLRVFRILKLGRYSRAIHRLGRALRETAPQIGVCLIGMVVLLVLGASVLYYLEHDSQPEGFSSIPAAAWWGITTMTTVGYGDLAPVTPLGKIAASIVAVLGVGLFALPAGIWASAFIREFSESSVCPHCGKAL